MSWRLSAEHRAAGFGWNALAHAMPHQMALILPAPLQPLSSFGGFKEPFRGWRGRQVLWQRCWMGWMCVTCAQGCLSWQVVPRQPHSGPSRAHADAGAPRRSLPGAQEERAQLLRHLLQVCPCDKGGGCCRWAWHAAACERAGEVPSAQHESSQSSSCSGMPLE